MPDRVAARDGGVALAYLATQIQAFIDRESGDGHLKIERALLATALADVQAIAATMVGWLTEARQQPRRLYRIGLASVRFLLAVGDLLIGWRLLVAAEVALGALGTGTDEPGFYQGKIAVAEAAF